MSDLVQSTTEGMQERGGHPVTEEASPLPWEIMAGTDHHGAYIVSASGLDVCDLYAMSNPMAASMRNGGTSFPVPFRDMDANARLIVRAVNSHDALVKALEYFIERTGDIDGCDCEDCENVARARAALAVARGEP